MALAAGTAYVNNARTTVTIPITGGTNPILPATGVTGFSVTENVSGSQVAVSISSAVVTANAVVLTLAHALTANNLSKYAYDSGTGNVHDSAGSPLTLGDISATNILNPAALALGTGVLNSARTTITIPVTGGTTPYLPGSGLAGFHAWKMVNGHLVEQTLDSQAVSSSNIVLTLHTAAGASDQIYYSYELTTGNLHDSTGGAGLLAPAKAASLVTNPRVLVASAAEFGTARTQIRVRIANANGALGPTSPSGFAVAGSTISAQAISGDEVVLTLSAPVSAGTNPAVSATSSDLTDAAGGSLPDFSGLVARDNQQLGHTKVRRNGQLRFGLNSNTL